MTQLTQMPENQFTTRILNLFGTQENVTKDFGIFIEMDFVDTDLKKLMNSVENVDLEENHTIILMYNMLCAFKFL